MWIRLLIIIPSFAVPAYWAITFTGMYAAIATWDAGGNGGEYSVTLAFLLPVLFFLLPGFAITLLIAQFFPEKNENDPKI